MTSGRGEDTRACGTMKRLVWSRPGRQQKWEPIGHGSSSEQGKSLGRCMRLVLLSGQSCRGPGC